MHWLNVRPAQRTAFSLIEMLVVVGVVGILLAILLPMLGKSREAARRTGSLANLRTIGQLLHAYSDRSNGAYPWALRGLNGCGIPVQFSPIWQMDLQWPLVLHEVMEPRQIRQVSLAPGARREGPTPQTDPCGHPPSYYYSRSFLAVPEFWSRSGTADERLLRGVRTDMVTYPSSKCLMWDWELPYQHRELRTVGPDLAEPTPMLFADGHGAENTPANAAAPTANPLTGDVTRLHNTPDGVRGRDY